MTHCIHFTTMARLIPLEVFSVYGLFESDYYNQYFYNETKPEITDAELDHYYKTKLDQKNFVDFKTEAGRREYEKEMNKFISLYPGALVKEGEALDFKRLYAADAILNNEDTSKFDSNLIESVKKAFIKEDKDKIREQTDVEEGKDGHHDPKPELQVGTVFPKAFESKHKKVIM